MSTEPAIILVRMKPLAPRLRLAHLRALIRCEPVGSARARRLAALLRDQLTAAQANENRAI
ncbi:MAG TPA: hypothetical protein VKA03_00440 [Methylovirgula sp.]|nr:hypothetical protein [Methylovirgula sp.]